MRFLAEVGLAKYNEIIRTPSAARRFSPKRVKMIFFHPPSRNRRLFVEKMSILSDVTYMG